MGAATLCARLTLVSNPAGAFLGHRKQPPSANGVNLSNESTGVTFEHLFVLNNMPISRLLEWLQQSGNLETYMQKLVYVQPGGHCRSHVPQYAFRWLGWAAL
jgi:hypothetical protein